MKMNVKLCKIVLYRFIKEESFENFVVDNPDLYD